MNKTSQSVKFAPYHYYRNSKNGAWESSPLYLGGIQSLVLTTLTPPLSMADGGYIRYFFGGGKKHARRLPTSPLNGVVLNCSLFSDLRFLLDLGLRRNLLKKKDDLNSYKDNRLIWILDTWSSPLYLPKLAPISIKKGRGIAPDILRI